MLQRAAAVAASPTPADEPPKLIDVVAVAVTVRDHPVIAGILEPATIRALRPYATVNQLLPNDAEDVLRCSTPDVFLVEATAGQAGPWTGLGTYTDPERDRQLLELVQLAKAVGIPVVLWPGTHGALPPLFPAAKTAFDVVLAGAGSDGTAWHPGVDLAASEMTAASGDPAERRRHLRALFRDEASPVQLQRLLTLVGITYDMPSRAVSVLELTSWTNRLRRHWWSPYNARGCARLKPSSPARPGRGCVR